MSEFSKYLHVENINRDEVAGILDGIVYVQPKIDGTNACVWCDADSHEICAGSRKRQITVESDNCGFANYIINSYDRTAVAIRAFCRKYPGVAVYGEWLGDPTNDSKMLGSLRRYLKKGFFAFDLREIPDASDDSNRGYINPTDYRYASIASLIPDNFVTSTILNNPKADDIIACAKENHFNLPDDVVGEGVVVKNYNFVSKYGRFEMAKVVLDEFRQAKSKSKKPVVQGDVERDYVGRYVTDAFLDKCKAKVVDASADSDEFDIRNAKMIGRFMTLAVHDAIGENITDAMKRFKYPVIDFNALKAAIQQKGRAYLGI